MPIHGELQTKTEEQNYEELMERLKAAATTSFDLYSLAEKAIWFLNECRETLKKDREYNLQRIGEMEERISNLLEEKKSLASKLDTIESETKDQLEMVGFKRLDGFYKHHLSDRLIPLLYTKHVGGNINPIISLENYGKWYSIFIIRQNDFVEKIPMETIQDILDKYTKPLWIDHCFHPLLLLIIAYVLDAVVDDISLETAYGRWLAEEHPNHTTFTYYIDDVDIQGLNDLGIRKIEDIKHV